MSTCHTVIQLKYVDNMDEIRVLDLELDLRKIEL